MTDSHRENLSVQSTPKITKAEKSEKIKDPRKVEAGKRLAATSREKTAVEVVTVSTEKPEDCCTSIEKKYIIGGVGVAAAVGSLLCIQT